MTSRLMIVIAVAACSHSPGGGDDDDAGPTPVIVPCPNCPDFPPPSGSGSVGQCSGTGVDPTLVYPPDNVLLPPNMNVIDAHFMPGDNNVIFEIDFENAATDVRLETMCNPITNTRGSATGGCDFALDVTDWNYISQTNKGGDPLAVTVRAAPADLSCVSTSDSRNISFAQEDMAGGIYYWQSVTQNGIAGTTGGIFRKDFGDATPMGEPFLTPGTQNKCVGCHFLSRDGAHMTYGSDDADSDDEYGDLHGVLYDVANRTALGQMLPPGFQTFQADGHLTFLASDGRGMSNQTALLQFDGSTGKSSLPNATFVGVAGMTGKRATQPDWSRDGSKVYFAAGTPFTVAGFNNVDDSHFTNCAIWSVDFDTGTKTFSNAAALVTPANVDESDYYPSISPDGNFVVFDRAIGTTPFTHDNYNNQNAQLFGLPTAGGTPVALANANYKDGMTNSWPRFSPFVQEYKGKHILWITFSSTRDYGLRVENENPPTGATFNCYPPVSPEDTSGDHSKPFDPNCTQPQIWMAAITLEDLQAGSDGSFPAFWLPFQDDTAHNHIAQWVDTVVNTCTGGNVGDACSTANPCCAGLSCDPTSMTCESIIF